MFQALFGAICAVLLLCLPATRSYAENLADLQEKAVANRQLIEKYRNNIRKAQTDINIGKGYFLPSLDLSYTGNKLDEDGTLEKAENSTFATAVSYNIFAGFRDKYTLQAAEQIKKSQDYELEKIIQDIKYRVAARYVEIFGKKNSLVVAQDELNLLKKRYEDSENRYQVGLIRKNDLLKIKVEMDDTEQRLKRADSELSKSANLLAFEIEAPVDPKAISFEELKRFPKLLSEEEYSAKMFEKRSDIKALEMVIEAYRSKVYVAKSAYYPSADIIGSYKLGSSNYTLGLDNTDSEDEYRLQLNVRMNIFDGFKKNESVKKADVEVRNAQHDLAELKNSLTTELKNTLSDYDVAVKNMKVAEASIVQAEENLRITDASYKEGVDTATGVLDAIFYLSRAKNNFINARNEVFANYYKLTRLTDDF